MTHTCPRGHPHTPANRRQRWKPAGDVFFNTPHRVKDGTACRLCENQDRRARRLAAKRAWLKQDQAQRAAAAARPPHAKARRVTPRPSERHQCQPGHPYAQQPEQHEHPPGHAAP